MLVQLRGSRPMGPAGLSPAMSAGAFAAPASGSTRRRDKLRHRQTSSPSGSSSAHSRTKSWPAPRGGRLHRRSRTFQRLPIGPTCGSAPGHGRARTPAAAPIKKAWRKFQDRLTVHSMAADRTPTQRLRGVQGLALTETRDRGATPGDAISPGSRDSRSTRALIMVAYR